MAAQLTRRTWTRIGVTVLLAEAFMACTMVLGNLVFPTDAIIDLSRMIAGDHYAENQTPRLHSEGRVATTLHLLPSLVFVLVGIAQLWPKLRRRKYRPWHRWLGRTFIVTAILSSLTGMYMSIRLNYTGWDEIIPSFLFGTALVAFCTMGWIRARQRDFPAHQEWMILALASGLGITLARIYLMLLTSVTGQEATEFFGSIFWMGSGSNVVLALIWLGVRRRMDQKDLEIRKRGRKERALGSVRS
ncbi:DUF2306 domain-containing protein [Nocardiopsis tropica]|uniref:DUF2306 domain-containing protein n=1 Tax=Nocardiopsis tropica TaxID=109330 RepID=A0ABU7KKC8_9ACTN|nr:DUF2306 domain-containing protein [Nocardiopsis umidischolae]MEE2049750.1 DUF2306 domain-containing protein [Nocardiopsis umidischolae]